MIIKILFYIFLYEAISLLILGKLVIIDDGSEVSETFIKGVSDCRSFWTKVLFTFLAAAIIIPIWIYSTITAIIKVLKH